ncbi:MAG: polyprenyl synthetase family protein [bacterium]
MTKDSTDKIDQCLDEVRKLMAESLADTVLHRLAIDCKSLLGNGKMLRSRLAFRVGPDAGISHRTLLYSSAAVEMIHGASLLHDDVIDGGYLRRSAPTFWVERGVPGAILVGDLLLFKALDIIGQVEDGRLVHTLVRMTGEVCDAESEQELILRGKPGDWDSCVRIARRKTGALFAFSAHACAGTDAVLAEALTEAGYAVGTAYQLADDILDVKGTEAESGKTLGTDQGRAKTTAATVHLPDGVDTASYIDRLCEHADRALARWPKVRAAWQEFMTLDIRPAIAKHLSTQQSVTPGKVSDCR